MDVTFASWRQGYEFVDLRIDFSGILAVFMAGQRISHPVNDERCIYQ